jgi:hypothetical protein
MSMSRSQLAESCEVDDSNLIVRDELACFLERYSTDITTRACLVLGEKIPLLEPIKTTFMVKDDNQRSLLTASVRARIRISSQGPWTETNVMLR